MDEEATQLSLTKPEHTDQPSDDKDNSRVLRVIKWKKLTIQGV